MDAERYQQVKAVLDAALEVEPDKRAAFLDEKCADDPELRVAVEALLAAHDKAQSFLEHPGAADRTTVTVKGPGGKPERIGPYKILEKLGEGGMGVVYLVEQVEPIRRRVALKLIKLGMDSKQVVARFEAERQALALMDHPNVAKVFDAGATDEGRPYFVMEYVKGIPITKYCDQNRLSNRDRLGLFIQVCEAIQHAHQKGIIHRDVKPSNVLVMLQDGKPVPKVIDFGVAKATSQQLTERTLFTQHGILVGTPEYMSPEQAGTTGLDVDTRTDVYSLGVLLYELLIGALPFEPRRLREAAALEMQRIIHEEEPPKPSTKLNSLGDSANDSARLRRSDVRSLEKQLQGDLDWITMKALEKDRTRRYETASQLAGDIEHHLADEPIAASPPGMVYKFRKFVKRNRVAVAALSLVVAALAMGLVVAMIGFVQASHERDRTMEAEQRAQLKAYVANISAADASLRMGEAALAKRRLANCPESLRGWEWEYLRSQTDLATATLTGHESSVFSVAFSPDGTRIASGSGDNTVRLWDATSGEPMARLVGHEGSVFSVAFSPDGKRIASESGDETVRLWDATSGELLGTLTGYGGDLVSVAFSPDGTRIAAGSEDKTIHLLDSTSGEPLATLAGHEGSVLSVVFSPDGTRIASGSDDKSVRLWDATSGELLATLTGHEDAVRRVVFSSDGARITSVSEDNTTHVWDASSGELLATLTGHEDLIAWGEWSFSPDGWRIAFPAEGAVVHVWDASSGELATRLVGHKGGKASALQSIEFSPDGTRIASDSADGTVRLWDATSGEPLATLTGHEDAVFSVAFSPDGTRIASGSADKTVRLWGAVPQEVPATLMVDRKSWIQAQSVAFSPDGKRIASVYGGGEIILWDATSGELLARLFTDGLVSSDVAFSPDGTRIAAGSSDKTTHIWDSRSGEILARLVDTGGGPSVTFSPDGRRIATGSYGKTIRLWDAVSGELLGTFTGHEKGVNSVAFSPDGTRIASGSADETVRLWDSTSGEPLATLAGHEGWVSSVAFSPDGTRIASGSEDETVRLWDGVSGEPVARLADHEDRVWSVAFSPDGTRIASGADDMTVRLWDAATGELLTRLRATDWVYSVAFSPDGTRIAAGSEDGTIRLWDATRSGIAQRWAAIARGYEQRGQAEIAEPFRRAVVETRRRSVGGEGPAGLTTSLVLLVANLNRQGKYAEAEPLAQEALETARAAAATESWRVPQAMSLLGQSLAGQGLGGEAKQLLVAGLHGLLPHPEAPLETRCRALKRIAGLHANPSSVSAAVHPGEWGRELARELDLSGQERLARLLLACEGEEYDVNALNVALALAQVTNEDDPRVLMIVGVALGRSGEPLRALPYLRSALSMLPPGSTLERSRIVGSFLDLAETLFWRARSLHRDGRHEEAEVVRRERLRVLGELLSLDFGNTLYMGLNNDYAWDLLTTIPTELQDAAEALRFAIQANEMTGYENPDYLKTLALAYHLTGDTEKAIETQKKAISLLPHGSSRDRTEFEERLTEFEAALTGKT